MPSTGVWARGFSMQSRKKFRTVDRRSLTLLKAYGWPGNVRELQNVIERAVILSDGDILRVDETLTQTAGATTRWSDSGAQQHAAKAGKGND